MVFIDVRRSERLSKSCNTSKGSLQKPSVSPERINIKKRKSIPVDSLESVDSWKKNPEEKQVDGVEVSGI